MVYVQYEKSQEFKIMIMRYIYSDFELLSYLRKHGGASKLKEPPCILLLLFLLYYNTHRACRSYIHYVDRCICFFHVSKRVR